MGCGVAVCRSTAKKVGSNCCGGGVKVTSCFFQSCGKPFFLEKKEGVGGSRKSTEVFLKEDMPTVQSRKCHGDRRLVA